MMDGLLAGFEVVVALPVAWGDMDAFQHVNNTRYFRYMEDARIAYFERTGIAASEGRPTGVGPILASTSCRFKAPIAYPDEVNVGAKVVSVGRTSFKMEFRIVSVALHEVAAEGQAIVVAYDYDEERKVAIPEAWRNALSRVEGCDFPGTADEP
ncbi:MAG: acyl-CoA thioesterase [Myxococcales bacterium]|nr:acyl-CoA thioesterase [Myxococcales bacterium]MCB9737531.1 acyl-CoA thioesterase [Deltaproteobacteria bacterium]